MGWGADKKRHLLCLVSFRNLFGGVFPWQVPHGRKHLGSAIPVFTIQCPIYLQFSKAPNSAFIRRGPDQTKKLMQGSSEATAPHRIQKTTAAHGANRTLGPYER